MQGKQGDKKYLRNEYVKGGE